MCGIAGIAGIGDVRSAEETVRGMTAALARRGPDGEGIYAWPHTVLGHRRLSIFDLSAAGSQPMVSEDGSFGVVFNGAIYNFRDLRRELEGAGYTFRSESDTEVLVHGYRAWGLDRLVARLRGMFAFALWDESQEALFLVRDRLGVKPLLYAQQNGAIAFASTADALHRAGYGVDIDEAAVAEFLEYGFVTDARCIYRNVHKLPAAHILEWRAGEIRLREYWQPPQPSTDSRQSFQETVERAEALFLEAVRLRLKADVPVGALLSGGVDSSLVCWAIAKLGGDVTAFTIATPGDVFDEGSAARATAKTLGLRHRVLIADPAHSPDVNDLTRAFAEPFSCASALGLMSLSEAVKQEATVLLTGDGGDDAFLGYPRHRHYAYAQRLARFTPSAAAMAWRALRVAIPRAGMLRRAAHFADYAVGGLGAVVSAHDGIPAYAAMGMLGDRFAGAAVEARNLPWSLSNGRRVLDDFIAYERRTRFVGEYMTKVDGATMYHALEARAPFLDHELWTFAAALPYDLRLHGNSLKAVLREMTRRNIGEPVAQGKKRGFGIPVQRWITGRWRSSVEESFRYSILDREGWIRSDAVLKVLKQLPQGATAPVQLWHLYVLESWMKNKAFTAEVRAKTAIA